MSVRGTMRRIGGIPELTVGVRGTVHFEAGDGTVASTETGPDGGFAIEVSPGRYHVSGTPHGWGGDGRPTCFAWDDPIDVPAGGLDGVEVICRVR